MEHAMASNMASSSSSEVPNHRACASCRSQKVRCIPDESNPDVCQRCARTNRPCVNTPMQKRKQRKRTDTRVAELEREMRAMRAALKQKGESASPDTTTDVQRGRPPAGLWYKDHGPNGQRLGQSANWVQSEAEDQSVKVDPTGPDLWPWKYSNKPLEESKDVIDRGMISMATARHLFETYKKDLFPHYPMVVIPPEVTAEEMRRTKPALFLAIIAAAASKENSDLSAALDKEVLQTYATRSLVQSEKSLELVQSLLISAVWYHPPTKFGQLKYYEFIHMAATMAMDIGLGSRPSAHRSRAIRREQMPSRAIHPAEDVRNPDLSMSTRSRDSSPDTGSVESRRTFLACYIICASVSLSLRRPNMLRISSYIRECIDCIEHSPNAIATDQVLVAWARLAILAEEISVAFCYDDPGGIASITELRIQLMLKDFERRLSAWYASLSDATSSTGSLVAMYYTVRLYLFEIALHVDHSSEDFKAPYQMGGIQPCPNADEIPTQVLAEAIAECISASHALLNTFFSIDADSARALPVFSYVRISFAAFVLAKLCLSSVHPQSRIGRVLDRSSLKVESYMDRAVLHVRSIVGERRTRVPSIFLALLFKLRQWCLNPDIIEQQDTTWEAGKRIMDRTDVTEDRQPSVIELEGPRIIEHFSSSESSPQTIGSDAHHSGGNASRPLSSVLQEGLDSAVQNDRYTNTSHYHDVSASGTMQAPQAIPTTSLSNSNLATVPEAPWSMDAMNIDSNLMQLLGDMNAFSEGGLTGLDAGIDMSGWNMDMTSWPVYPDGNGNTNGM